MDFLMPTSQPIAVTRLAGSGWKAWVRDDRIDLLVSPDLDPLPEAVTALIPPEDRYNWTCSIAPWNGVDVDGWDAYTLTRDDGVDNSLVT